MEVIDRIKNDINNNDFSHIYLVFGEENFLKKNVKKMICDALADPGDTMNFNRYEGTGINPKEVIDMAETLPFFAERRLILMENTGFLKSACEPLADYLAEVPESAYFVFVENDVDKRNKIYKLASKQGCICECSRLKPEEIKGWILRKIARENKKITRNTMDYLVEMLGNDMEKISNEIEKLLCYIGDRDVVEREDVDAICIPEITGKIFDMIDAMGNKQKEKALALYYDLLLNKEPPMRILYMLSRQFNIMLQIKDLSDRRMAARDIESKTGLRSFVINKTVKQLKNFSREDIRSALEKSVAIEEDVKQGNIADKIAVELMIVEFSS